ncbi:hypothetical protein [Burkholderia cepacia]|uniref:hypothetical protein n=1 Tax=Burkholderia cepacia TaxID=292 RepID=UPI0012D93721|nr:hypothetical protein [Burkholderia cepacia]
MLHHALSELERRLTSRAAYSTGIPTVRLMRLIALMAATNSCQDAYLPLRSGRSCGWDLAKLDTGTATVHLLMVGAFSANKKLGKAISQNTKESNVPSLFLRFPNLSKFFLRSNSIHTNKAPHLTIFRPRVSAPTKWLKLSPGDSGIHKIKKTDSEMRLGVIGKKPLGINRRHPTKSSQLLFRLKKFDTGFLWNYFTKHLAKSYLIAPALLAMALLSLNFNRTDSFYPTYSPSQLIWTGKIRRNSAPLSANYSRAESPPSINSTASFRENIRHRRIRLSKINLASNGNLKMRQIVKNTQAGRVFYFNQYNDPRSYYSPENSTRVIAIKESNIDWMEHITQKRITDDPQKFLHD